jgi:hypothetical protein
MDRWYSTGEAAKKLGVHPQTLRLWERQGRIKPTARSVGGQRRYNERDLESIAARASSEQTPGGEAARRTPAPQHEPRTEPAARPHDELPDWKRSTPPWEADRQSARAEVDVTRASLERDELLRRREEDERRRQETDAEHRQKELEQRRARSREIERERERNELVDAAVEAARWSLLAWPADETERCLMGIRRTVTGEVDDDWTETYAESRGRELVREYEQRDPVRRAQRKDDLVRLAAQKAARRYSCELDHDDFEALERDLKRHLRNEVGSDWTEERAEERAHEIADDLLEDDWDDEGEEDEEDDDGADDFDDEDAETGF